MELLGVTARNEKIGRNYMCVKYCKNIKNAVM